MEQYNWLTQYDSTNYYFWELAGDCAYEVAMPLLTLNYFDEAYRLSNNNPQLAYKYARFLNQLKVPLADINPIIDSGLSSDSLYFLLYELLGMINLDNNKNQNAEEILLKAYNLGDTSTFVINKYLAIGLFKNHKQIQSEKYFEKAYKLDSTDIFLNYAYACALYDIGEQYKAIDLLNYTKQIIFPDSAMVSKIYELEGDINTRYQRSNQAYNNYHTAIIFSAKNYEVLYKISKTCVKLEDFELAKDYINQYISAINNNTELTEKEKNSRTKWAKYNLEKIDEEIFFKDDPEALRQKRKQRMLDYQKKVSKGNS